MLKRDMQRVLRESVIDPRKDTSFRLDAELQNPTYCVTKALDVLNTLNLTKITHKQSDDAIKEAITLLAMARVMNTVKEINKVMRKV